MVEEECTEGVEEDTLVVVMADNGNLVISKRAGKGFNFQNFKRGNKTA